MICYAECFNTLINIFKVFHEPLLKALLPFIEHSAFYKGKISSAPQTNRWTALFNRDSGAEKSFANTNIHSPKILHLPD